MKVILLKDVPKVGQIHQIKEVADGFALNSLIPRKLAIPATPQAIAAHEKAAADRIATAHKQQAGWRESLAQLAQSGVAIELSADDKGHLYKKLDARTVAQILGERGLTVAASSIDLAAPIAQCGDHPVSIKTKEGSGTVLISVRAAQKQRR